jgi:hypothetical protein
MKLEGETTLEVVLGMQPEQMDKAARNKRLYEFLKQMGLFVEPVYSDTALREISYLKVSVAVPS